MSDELDQETAEIGAIVCRIGKLNALQPDEDFYDAGFSSIGALELLIELENACGVSIPDESFVAARTTRALADMVARLKTEQVA